MLSLILRQVTYALLTRSPVYSYSEEHFLLRLACVKHAASVRPEPGSNSPLYELFDSSSNCIISVLGTTQIDVNLSRTLSISKIFQS